MFFKMLRSILKESFGSQECKISPAVNGGLAGDLTGIAFSYRQTLQPTPKWPILMHGIGLDTSIKNHQVLLLIIYTQILRYHESSPRQ